MHTFAHFFSKSFHIRNVKITLASKADLNQLKNLHQVNFSVNEAIFLQNRNFGTYFVVVSFLLSFLHETQILF